MLPSERAPAIILIGLASLVVALATSLVAAGLGPAAVYATATAVAAALLYLYLKRFDAALTITAGIVLVLLSALIALLAINAVGAPPNALLSARWDPAHGVYGLLPAILGTIVVAGVATGIAAVLAISLAIVLSEWAPRGVRRVMAFVTDLAAGIPTVVYGLWGLTVLVPALLPVMQFLHGINSAICGALGLNPCIGPFSAKPTSGASILAASLVLAIMVVPYATAIIREGLSSVPKPVVEAIHAIGATRWEAAVLKLRYAKNFVLGGLLLALGRAMGETVAVAMVIGGGFSYLPLALTQPGITISSLIALQFPNAAIFPGMEQALYLSALVLTAMGTVINLVAIRLVFT